MPRQQRKQIRLSPSVTSELEAFPYTLLLMIKMAFQAGDQEQVKQMSVCRQSVSLQGQQFTSATMTQGLGCM